MRFQQNPIVRLQQQQQSSIDGSENSSIVIPAWTYRLNASTKWLVTLAAVLGIWTRVPHYQGPFIVVGSIASVYFTVVLKQIINHDRPTGSLLTDPGMPSSHSLVTFFMAAAWVSKSILSLQGSIAVLMGASMVALLRVICGYHSWGQIGVGAVLGSSMGVAWAKLGVALYNSFPVITVRASWAFYIMGSAFYIVKDMRDWLTKDKHI
ncbi:PAP2 superfamily [Seminavis robusta]|uniref:PAP2 superfamily n=1 Tax=Seminavis robusta TaxID=568900 RepID=A0A9N8DW94_9STRA|nr:PAP2 superfamily [Seminavis robusta]|eukprot:Sro410_g137440.1 PAP2 superfamily (208) ;mRNA; f:50791-51414